MRVTLQVLKGIARIRLRAIHGEIPYTIGISILDAKQLKNRILLTLTGPDYTCFKFPDGIRTPLHTSAPGKTLVAFTPEPERTRIIDSLVYVPLTSRTIRDSRNYRRCLDEVVRRGYALDIDEEITGCRCGGVPILDREGHAVAALFLSGVSSRLSEANILKAVRILQSAAAGIEADLRRYLYGRGPRVRRQSPFTRAIIAKMRTCIPSPAPLRSFVDTRHVSYSTARLVFKADTGLPMGQYFLNLRLCEAARLLRATRMTVSEICARLGFCNEKYLSTQFRRHFGLPPSAYRGKRGK